MNKKTLYTFQNSVHDPRKPRPAISPAPIELCILYVYI